MKGITCGVSLPEELVIEIFSRLAVHTLVRFRCVFKSCCNMITSPQFVKLHLTRSLDRNSGVILLHSADSFLASFDFHHPQHPVVQLHHPDAIKSLPSRNIKSDLDNLIEDSDDYDYFPAKIIGISNGIICFDASKHYQCYDCVLYNPATRASKQVPRPQVKLLKYGFASYSYEFGYDCIADDYKILCVVNLTAEESMFQRCGTETHLYSLKSNSWKNLENRTWSHWIGESCSVVANNSFYWVSDNQVITRFDLWNHTFGETEVPLPSEVKFYSRNIRLGVLKGRVHAMRVDGLGTSIWMLKEDYKWTLLFSSLKWKHRTSDWLLPYAYSKDGNKILVGVDKNMKAFVCCDLNSQTTTTVNVLGFPKGATFTAAPWVESLVQLG